MNEKQFTGKVAFVTGATSGIGHACAIAFAEAGANVVCVGRKEDALITYGWDKFLEGGDPKWLARLPMTKAVGNLPVLTARRAAAAAATS